MRLLTFGNSLSLRLSHFQRICLFAIFILFLYTSVLILFAQAICSSCLCYYCLLTLLFLLSELRFKRGKLQVHLIFLRCFIQLALLILLLEVS